MIPDDNNYKRKIQSFKWLMNEKYVVDALESGVKFIRELFLGNVFINNVY